MRFFVFFFFLKAVDNTGTQDRTGHGTWDMGRSPPLASPLTAALAEPYRLACTPVVGSQFFFYGRATGEQ